jgi:hypothetical protein
MRVVVYPSGFQSGAGSLELRIMKNESLIGTCRGTRYDKVIVELSPSFFYPFIDPLRVRGIYE